MNANGGVHVRLRRVGTIPSSHDKPEDISIVAATVMLINDQKRVRKWRVNNRAPGLAVEKESGVSDGQGWTLSGLLVVANDVQLDEGD